MKKIFKALIVLLLLAAVLGCATSVPLQVMKPSEINMGNMKKIAVLYFGYPDLGYGESSIEVIIRNTIGRYLGYAYNRNADQEAAAMYATDKFISLLMRTDYFSIIDPMVVQNAIIRANKINLTPAELGEILETDAMITGSISFMRAEVLEEEIPIKDEFGAIIDYRMQYTKTASLQVTYRILNAKTGQLVAIKSFEGETEAIEAEFYRLPRDEEMYREILDRILEPLPRQLVPYEVTEYRHLMNDETKDPEMERLNKLVVKKFYGEALEGYLTVWERTGNVAAGFNAAIMFEITGDIDAAIGLMTEVAQRTEREEALRELKRLQKTKAESEAASRQM